MSAVYTPNASNNPTAYTMPVDGDGPGIKVADVRAALEGLADKAAYSEKWRPIFVATQGNHEAGDPPYASLATTTSTTYATPGSLDVTIPDCLINDLILVDASFSVLFDDATTGAYGLLRMRNGPLAGTMADVNYAKFACGPADAKLRQVTLTGVAAVTSNGSWEVKLEYKVTNVAASLALKGPCVIRCTQLRTGG